MFGVRPHGDGERPKGEAGMAPVAGGALSYLFPAEGALKAPSRRHF